MRHLDYTDKHCHTNCPHIWYCYNEWTNELHDLPKSASELYRPSDHRLLEKLVATFADSGYRVVSVTNPYGVIAITVEKKKG
jgi:hypothetical protein